MPGWPETIFILIVVVLLFGAKKLPELARGLGQSLGEFKKARDEFERELRNSTAEVEVKTPADKQPHQPSPESSQGSVHAEGGVSGSKETEKPA
jgi:sec-independent protein translocase protein TatA